MNAVSWALLALLLISLTGSAGVLLALYEIDVRRPARRTDLHDDDYATAWDDDVKAAQADGSLTPFHDALVKRAFREQLRRLP